MRVERVMDYGFQWMAAGWITEIKAGGFVIESVYTAGKKANKKDRIREVVLAVSDAFPNRFIRWPRIMSKDVREVMREFES